MNEHSISMDGRGASRTAEVMAQFRAIESARLAKRRLFTHTYAREFLRPSYRMAVKLSRIPIIGITAPRFIDWRRPGARTSGIGRTRLIDDILLCG
jgi:O-methyltransferase involved in polyketide biosynthesis